MNELKGFDVSDDNGTILMAKVKSAGYPWGYAQACDGATYHDKTFAYNYKGMKDAGILPGAYGMAAPGTSTAHDEAAAFVRIVQACGGFELPPMFDLERDGGLTSAQLRQYARDWWSVVRAYWHGKAKPFLYTDKSFYDEHELHLLSDIFEFWLAAYDGTTTPLEGAKIRQYTDKGQVNGISGNVDIDIFYGTIEDLRALCVDQKHA